MCAVSGKHLGYTLVQASRAVHLSQPILTNSLVEKKIRWFASKRSMSGLSHSLPPLANCNWICSLFM